MHNNLRRAEGIARRVRWGSSECYAASPEWGFMLKLHEILDENIEKASLDYIASALDMSKSGLQKKLKKYTNAPFQDYVRGFKLSKARSLLKSGKANVSEAAYKSGFRSVSHFTRSFKDEFGYPPSKLIA